MKEKAARNKTIDFSLEEGKEYLKELLYERDIKADDCPQNSIIIGDTFKVCDRLKKESVDLVICDPPYNLSKDYNGNKFNEKSNAEYRKYTVSWIEKVLPLMKENASIYVCCDWKSSIVIGEVLEKYFYVRNRITWQREKGRGASANWKNGMEDIWFATKSKDYYFNLDAVKVRRKVIAPYKENGKPKDWEETEEGKVRITCPSNFWDDISIPYWSMPENTAHPTQKPEKLLAKLILASSKEGDMVFDPFMGSCSTAVTASKLNRNFLGVEQNELYGAWGMKRLEMAKEDSSIQGYVDGVFYERNSGAIQKKNSNKK